MWISTALAAAPGRGAESAPPRRRKRSSRKTQDQPPPSRSRRIGPRLPARRILPVPFPGSFACMLRARRKISLGERLAISPHEVHAAPTDGNDRCVAGTPVHGNVAPELRRVLRRIGRRSQRCRRARTRTSRRSDLRSELGRLVRRSCCGKFRPCRRARDPRAPLRRAAYKGRQSARHGGCGTTKATVQAIRSGIDLPLHLKALQHGIAP
jgi:hypothetical protein